MTSVSVFPRVSIAVTAFALCATIAMFSWPRFVGGAIVAPHQSLLRDIARGENIRASRIGNAEESLSVARTWFDYGKFATAYGALRLVSAQRSTKAQDQRAALDDSLAALKHGLASVPGQPYGWLQLAQSTRARDRNDAQVGRYLELSLLLAPWEHRLVMPRIELALQSWRLLDPGFRDRLPPQLMRAVDTAPLALATATRRSFTLREVRRMLAESPVHRDRFNIVYLSPD